MKDISYLMNMPEISTDQTIIEPITQNTKSDILPTPDRTHHISNRLAVALLAITALVLVSCAAPRTSDVYTQVRQATVTAQAPKEEQTPIVTPTPLVGGIDIAAITSFLVVNGFQVLDGNIKAEIPSTFTVPKGGAKAYAEPNDTRDPIKTFEEGMVLIVSYEYTDQNGNQWLVLCDLTGYSFIRNK